MRSSSSTSRVFTAIAPILGGEAAFAVTRLAPTEVVNELSHP